VLREQSENRYEIRFPPVSPGPGSNSVMINHPEERRVLGLLKELIVQSGMSIESLEECLGWESGRLRALLEGGRGLGLEDLLEVLPLLKATPADFFAWLYGFDPRESGLALEGGMREPFYFAEPGPPRRAMDRRFERSLRVVRDAVSRRFAWKQERQDG
jgi:transcriptional regulator with XRE-family HTH domain